MQQPFGSVSLLVVEKYFVVYIYNSPGQHICKLYLKLSPRNKKKSKIWVHDLMSNQESNKHPLCTVVNPDERILTRFDHEEP